MLVSSKFIAAPHRTAPARHVRPRLRLRTRTARPAGRPRRAAPRLGSATASATARPGPASERARVWFTVLLLPASQVVYKKSTF